MINYNKSYLEYESEAFKVKIHIPWLLGHKQKQNEGSGHLV